MISITVDDINVHQNSTNHFTLQQYQRMFHTIILNIKYSLKGSFAHFMINSTSGEIYPNSKSYVSVNTTYLFTVVATDQSVSFTDKATVVINVYNENSITDVIFIWALIAIVVFTSVLVITVLLWILFSFCVW